MSFSELVDRLPTEPYAKGRMFERLCRWYLENAPEYRLRVRKVWLWEEWPGRWGPDCGIDLVAETVDDGGIGGCGLEPFTVCGWGAFLIVNP